MSTKKFIFQGFIQATLAAVYIVLVALFMNNAERIIGDTKTFVGPVAFLLLFVLSAATVGSLVLGRSILMYIDKQKREAVYLFSSTMGWLFGYTVLALVILLLI